MRCTGDLLTAGPLWDAGACHLTAHTHVHAGQTAAVRVMTLHFKVAGDSPKLSSKTLTYR